MLRAVITALLSLALAASNAAGAHAQAKYPTRPVELIVSTAPCGESTWRTENDSSATDAGVAAAATTRPVA